MRKKMVTYGCNGFDVRVTEVFKVNHSMVISYNVLYQLILSYNWMQQRKSMYYLIQSLNERKCVGLGIHDIYWATGCLDNWIPWPIPKRWFHGSTFVCSGFFLFSKKYLPALSLQKAEQEFKKIVQSIFYNQLPKCCLQLPINNKYYYMFHYRNANMFTAGTQLEVTSFRLSNWHILVIVSMKHSYALLNQPMTKEH